MTALLREVAAAARSQAVSSALTIAVVAGMCAAVLLTTGRAVAAEQAVLAQVDAAGTRSIVVRASEEAGLTVALLDRLRGVEGIEAAAGFGPIVDARNAAIAGAPPVAVRPAYGVIADRPMYAPQHPAGRTALASDAAIAAFGLRDGSGGITTDHGEDVVVVGGMTVPEHLRFLEPLVVIPSSSPAAPAGDHPEEPLAMLVVLARSPQEVAVVEAVVRSLLTDAEQGTVTVETSAELAEVRAAVNGELRTYGRGTVLAILAVSTVLVAANLLALVIMRRRDFGRRRALGATRGLIVALIMGQVAVLAVAGAVVGTSAAVVGLAAAGHPLPDVGFATAVGAAGVLVAVAAAVVPAVVASRRDPLHELRVP